MPGRIRPPSLGALANRHFRWFWFGRLAVSAGFEMGTIAQGWLVYELTGSALALSGVSTGTNVAMFLLSPYGGVLSDRADKRSVLLWTRLAVTINLAVITLLVASGKIAIWHLALSALVSGVLYALMMPTQQAIVSDLVDRQTLLNAISLNAVAMGMMATVAASSAGFLVEAIGVAGAYAVMVGLNVFAVYAVARLPRLPAVQQVCRSVWADLRAGLGYLRSERTLLAIVAMALVRIVLVMPYRTFMPKFTTEEMGLDAAGLGILMGAASIGGLITSVIIASASNVRGKGWLLLGGGLVAGAALMLLAAARSLPLALGAMMLLGAGNNVCMITGATLLQFTCVPEYRGRVMGVDMMVWGLAPLGTLPTGALADRIGVGPVLGILGIIVLACVLALTLLTPRLRRLE